MKVWLVGVRGMLAQAVARSLAHANVPFVGSDINVDIADSHAVQSFAADHGFTHILNCAAYTQVDKAETDEPLAMRVNGVGPGNLGQAALRLGASLVHISTDYVFDGEGSTPYREDAPCRPLGAYGRSKWQGEQQLAAAARLGAPVHLIRTSWLYGRGGKNFVSTMLRLMQERDTLRVVADQWGRPTYCDDLAAAMLALAGLTGSPCAPFGIYHYANSGATTWHGFATEIRATAQALGIALRCQALDPIATADYPLPAKRPAYSVLATDKLASTLGSQPRPWQETVQEYLHHWAAGNG